MKDKKTESTGYSLLPHVGDTFDKRLTTDEVIHEIEKQGLLSGIYERINKRLLDTDNIYRMAEIAKEVGVSLIKLKRMIESKEFQEAYNDFFFKTVSDPRIKAIQDGLVDLAPDIWRVYRECLSPDAPYTVRAKMAMYLGEIIGIKKQNAVDSDTRELADFLARKGIHADSIQIINNQNVVNIPEDYKKALLSSTSSNIIDVED